MGDALRHKSARRRRVRIGRGASRTACDAERRTIVEVIVPRAGKCSEAGIVIFRS
ncbi:DUF1534 domain-containing protein [Pseudomonas syringae pv. maculicola str. ES4326]|uniref:DUF1534 domain-containing protein n=1 Tax=Pseudomonas syringae pv. maculicola str. ES4326 TaxID=629265 RepID=A0A8T8BW72_PSEYM|nr:DUF1534 domain-containing protein [Pseudomonas syringae pv. maculicola str. ES4326]